MVLNASNRWLLLLLLFSTTLLATCNAIRRPPRGQRRKERRVQTVFRKGGKGGQKSYSHDTHKANWEIAEGLEVPDQKNQWDDEDGFLDIPVVESAEEAKETAKGKEKDNSIISDAQETLAPTFKITKAPSFYPSLNPTKKPTFQSTQGGTDNDSPATPDPTPEATETPATPGPTAEATDATATQNATQAVTNSRSDAPTTAPTQSSDTTENAQGAETAAPSTMAPTLGTETAPPSTEAPVTVTLVPAPSTEAPVETLSPTRNVTGENSNTGGDETTGGMFDGEDYYHRHLVPFAVSVEGDEVTNDLGITSCLLTDMQKNMSNLFNLDMENFTVVRFNDEDGDGYNRYDLYFSGFAEILGLPVYPQEYVEEVQLGALGDGVEFYQACLDDRFASSGQSYTASALGHDQSTPDNMETDSVNKGVETDETDEDDELRTSLIIGLTVAAVVVALCGILFASRVMKGDEEAEAVPDSAKLE